MDWDFAIERNREGLRQVLAALLAMAGLAGLSSAWKLRRSEGGTDEACPRPTLLRHVHRAVLRLLRPAEAAARRLVVIAARGVVVTLPRPRLRLRKAGCKPPVLRAGVGTGILMPACLRPEPDRTARPLRPAALPLFDPLRRPGGRRRQAGGVPRISFFGRSAPSPVSPERQSKGRRPLSPDDRIDAARLALRLSALGRALDDLPREAKRFARWRTRRDAAGAQIKDPNAAGAQVTRVSGRQRASRLSPLRLGRPPGLPRRPVHAVHEILRDAHGLAFELLQNPDTS